MMTLLHTLALKIARPTLAAAAILLLGPVFAMLDRALQGAPPTIVSIDSPQTSKPSHTTIIYKNSFLGT
jgi:hypothetical protein